jgi:hypothetical protein
MSLIDQTGCREVIRLRPDNWYDYFGIAKSFLWDNPVEIDDHLFLGNFSHSFFLNTLNQCRIKAIVNATTDAPNYYFDQKIDYYNIPISDLNDVSIAGFLEESRSFIDGYISKGENVMVHCIFGRSRSVAICVYYLMKKYGIPFEKAYGIIENKKSCININQSFADQIKKTIACMDTNKGESDNV